MRLVELEWRAPQLRNNDAIGGENLVTKKNLGL